MVLRHLRHAILLGLLSAPVFAETPAAPISYVGAISINPCQNAKILADWYAKFGLETTEMQGGFYGQFDTPTGPLIFGIQPKKKDAPETSSASIAIVFRVEDFTASLTATEARGRSPESTEQDEMGRFAHFHDPDGNKVSIWGN